METDNQSENVLRGSYEGAVLSPRLSDRKRKLQEVAETETGLARKLAASLAEEIGWDLYDLYFSPNTICVEHGRIVVQANDTFSLDRIRSQFQNPIRNLAQRLLGSNVDVIFGLMGQSRVQKSFLEAAPSPSSANTQIPNAPVSKKPARNKDPQDVQATVAMLRSVRSPESGLDQQTDSFSRSGSLNRSNDIENFGGRFLKNEVAESLPNSIDQNPPAIQSTPLSEEASNQIGKIDSDGYLQKQTMDRQLGLFGEVPVGKVGEQAVHADQGNIVVAKQTASTGHGVVQAAKRIPNSQGSRVQPDIVGNPNPQETTQQAFLPGSKQGMSLVSFQFGENNHLAKAATQQVIAAPGQISPLVIFGNVGCGKTHLATGLGQFMKKRFRSFTVMQLSAEQFTSRFLEALNGSGLPSLRSKLRQVDLLILEDIQFFAGKKATLIELQHTLDTLIKAGKQLILTADRHPNDLSFLSTEVQTRLVSGLLIPLNPADCQARVEICEQWCAQRQFKILPEMTQWIAENISGDVRRLSGALFRVMAMQLSGGQNVTPSTAMDLLSDYVSASSTVCSLGQIQKVVSGICGVATEEINGSRRTKKISGARMLAMFLARKHTAAALSEIGDFFGGRKHSTVLAAEKRVKSWVEENSFIETASSSTNAREVIRKIESQLRAM